MATFTDYKGLDVVEDATGDGGIAITDNFKELADRAPYQTASNPGVNDDSTKGFSPGDQWLNTSTQVLWACVSNSSGAAVWKSVMKRTATALELIPEETSEKVHVAGDLQVDGESEFAGANFSGAVAVNSSTQSVVIPLNSQRDALYTWAGLNLILNTAAPSSCWTIFAEKSVAGGGIGGSTFQIRRRNSSQSEVYTPFVIDQGGNMILLAGHSAGSGSSIVGKVGIGTHQPSARLDVNGDTFRLRTNRTPASASAAGNQGDHCWDDDYVYVCVATNTWKRAALATW